MTTTAHLSSSPQRARNPPHSHHTTAHTDTCHIPVRTRTRSVGASRERPGGEGVAAAQGAAGSRPLGETPHAGLPHAAGTRPGPRWVPSASRGVVRTVPPAPAPSSRRHLSGLPSCWAVARPLLTQVPQHPRLRFWGGNRQITLSAPFDLSDLSSSRRLCSGPGPSPRCFQKLCRSEPRVASA